MIKNYSTWMMKHTGKVEALPTSMSFEIREQLELQRISNTHVHIGVQLEYSIGSLLQDLIRTNSHDGLKDASSPMNGSYDICLEQNIYQGRTTS